jgi:hypothetical protein
MERLVDLDPSNIKTRFSLAYKHSEVGNNDLALFHYLRIPYNERDPVTWNNLGVSFDQFNLAAKSVHAYRKAEEAGETLAMSNLAQKFITAGFLPEAQERCDAALKTESYHSNIPHTIARLKNLPNEEEKKEAILVEKARPISDFYMEYGRALSRAEVSDLAQRWKGPSCDLDITLQDAIFEAEGSYELPQTGLAGALLGDFSGFGSGGKTPPVRYHVKYYGTLRGYGIEGIVIRGREDELPKRSTLASLNENEPRVLMIVSDDRNEIHVMERKQGMSPQFYTLGIREPRNRKPG